MESVQSTWKFCRKETGPAREPTSLGALHALQAWRRGHPGRAYRIVRGTPFVHIDQLVARLALSADDLSADTDLSTCCTRQRLQSSLA